MPRGTSPLRPNKTGKIGVKTTPSKKFVAQAMRAGVYVYLGTYLTVEEAANAYRAFKERR